MKMTSLIFRTDLNDTAFELMYIKFTNTTEQKKSIPES